MANPFPFVAGEVLTAADMNGIGEAVAYTPTFTNFTLGNGTVTASYVQVQKMVQVSVTITFGSTSSMTGQIIVSKPVTGAGGGALNTYVGVARLADSGTGVRMAAIRNDSTGSVSVRALDVSATYPTEVNVSSTVPFTWTTNDQLLLSFVYEAA